MAGLAGFQSASPARSAGNLACPDAGGGAGALGFCCERLRLMRKNRAPSTKTTAMTAPMTMPAMAPPDREVELELDRSAAAVALTCPFDVESGAEEAVPMLVIEAWDEAGGEPNPVGSKA